MTLGRKAIINLLKGWPSPSLLPPEALKAAAGTVLSDQITAVDSLQYGPDEGYHPLRQEVARWLTSFYQPKEAIKADRICITGGASQNLACILQTFTDPLYTRNVWMVSPTYFLACRIFDDAGFAGKLKSIPEGEEGIDLDALSLKMTQSEQEALAEGNIKPVRMLLPRLAPFVMVKMLNCTAMIDNQTFEAVAEDLQACHLRCADLCESVWQVNEPWPSRRPGSSCQAV